MNYPSPPLPQMKQSDEIFKKLSQIKNAINPRHEASPNNLNDYLPNQRINTSAYNTNTNTNQNRDYGYMNNTESYRQSLEKKLERLFKEERAGFNESMQMGNNEKMHIEYNASNENKVYKRDTFTIERMEQKIKELEKKYLDSNPIVEARRQIRERKEKIFSKDKPQKYLIKDTSQKIVNFVKENNTPNKKTKSLYEKKSGKNYTKSDSCNKNQAILDKSAKKLMSAIEGLKLQLNAIKKSNQELNEKIQHKQEAKKFKKERTRYLLRCILQKLVQIQQEVKRDEKKEKLQAKRKLQPAKTPVEERQQLKRQNYQLLKQVEDLNRQLKKEMSEKQIAEERTRWMENQFLKRNEF